MATRRHVRKMASGWVGCCVGVVLSLWMLVLAVPIGAATTEHVVTDRNSGLAIHGFDPVAYFTDGAPSLGKGEFEHRHAGVVWRFRNPGNRAAFAGDPDIYMPRFGGYDPVGVGRGVPLAGDPRHWIILDERLYLFQSPENKAIFVVDSERALLAADDAWPAVLHALTP